MGANPEPSDGLTLNQANGAVLARHANRPEPRVDLQTTEMQTRMGRIGEELLIGGSRRLPHLKRELAVKCPESRRGERVHNWLTSSGVVLPWATSSSTSFTHCARFGRGV